MRCSDYRITLGHRTTDFRSSLCHESSSNDIELAATGKLRSNITTLGFPEIQWFCLNFMVIFKVDNGPDPRLTMHVLPYRFQ